ncbi:MAG: dTDP-4-dehydrorhamnose reductase [Bacteroidota bacterium]
MTPLRILVIGSNGLLGQKVVELFVRGSISSVTCASLERDAVRTLRSLQYLQVDITSKKDVRRIVSVCEPEVIVNCAAMTNVDACEREKEKAWKINVVGVENMTDAAKKYDSRVVHVSSDYVYDGTRGPYSEIDRPEPLSYYGKTKLASENVLLASGLPHFIARTMVLYGYAEGVRPNFALWLLDNLERGKPLRIVEDQFGNPTFVDDLAYGIMKGVELEKTGMYHIAGRDIVSRYAFAVTLARVFGLNEDLLTPVKTAEMEQPAPRPLRSGLITLKAEVELGIKPSTVEEGLTMLRGQLARSGRRIGDRGAAPGQKTGRSFPGNGPGRR